MLLLEQSQVRQNMEYDDIPLVAPFGAGDVARDAHDEVHPQELPSFVSNYSI